MSKKERSTDSNSSHSVMGAAKSQNHAKQGSITGGMGTQPSNALITSGGKSGLTKPATHESARATRRPSIRP